MWLANFTKGLVLDLKEKNKSGLSRCSYLSISCVDTGKRLIKFPSDLFNYGFMVHVCVQTELHVLMSSLLPSINTQFGTLNMLEKQQQNKT